METNFFLPIAKKVKKQRDRTDFVLTGQRIPIPCLRRYDFCVQCKKYPTVFRCYSNNIYSENFCKKCCKFFSSQTCIKIHCVRNHNLEHEYQKRLKQKVLKFVLLNNQYLSIVDNYDFQTIFPVHPISRKTITKYLDLLYGELKMKIKKKLQKESYMSIYFDEWTRFSFNFMNNMK